MPDPVTGITVGTSLYGQESMQERQLALQEEEFQFAQQMYEEWNEVFGGLQENLADYYNGLTPESYAAQGLEAFEEERAKYTTQVNEILAQRGITPESGVSAGVAVQDALDTSRERSRIRRDAPSEVAQQKSSFLNLGLNRKPDLQDAYAKRSRYASDATGVMRGRTADARNVLDTANKGYATSTAGLVEEIGTGLSDYFESKEEQ